MRQLATVQKINRIEPILGADSIVKATILGWEVVVRKDEFQEGDLVVYCEVDSVLPEKPEFEFLRDKKFRIKTIKLKGQVSQGICFPLSILPFIPIYEGQDVTDILGVTKWEAYDDEPKMQKQSKKAIYPKWIPKWLMRFKFVRNLFTVTSAQKTFPSLISKTDETRVQVLQPLLDKYKGTPFYATEKLDGSSTTIYLIKGKFGVCSRNIDLARSTSSKYWNTAIEHNLEKKIKGVYRGNIALQGELIGEGIQGNKYKLKGQDIYFFNIFFINEDRYGNYEELKSFCDSIGEKCVPLVLDNYELSNSIPELVVLAKGKSLLADTPREGIVLRPCREIKDTELHSPLVRNRVSFKSINPDFLIKYNL